MQINNIFKEWAPSWLIKGVLIYCMLPSMMLLGLYNSNNNFTASYLDIEPEDLQFIICITYGTLVATVIIEGRFFRYFATRNYFLAIHLASGLIILLSAFTKNYYQFIFLRIAEGICMALPGISLRMLLLSRFTSKNALIIVYSIFYGVLLCSSSFTIHLMVWLMDRYNWMYMAYGAAIFHAIGMLLILLVFNGKRFAKKLPLYQVDWISYILLLPGTLCGCFVLVYGEKKYWFQSPQIVIALAIALCCLGFFVLRQLYMRRPAIHMDVFYNRQVLIGIVLCIILYTARAALNLCNTTMNDIWQWEPIYIAHVQYINAAGIVAGLVIAGYLLHEDIPYQYIFSAGFLVLAGSYCWFTFLFVPDVHLTQIAIPYFLQGVGVGVLFVPIVFLITATIPQSMAISAGFAAIGGRFWGTTIGFCIIQNSKIYLQREHYSKLQQFVLPESSETQSRLAQLLQSFMSKGYSQDAAHSMAMRELNSSVSKQSILLANMEIYTAITWVMIGLAVIMLLNTRLLAPFRWMRAGTMRLMPRTMW